MATNKKTTAKAKTPAKPKPEPGTWFILKNATTGEQCVCDSESFDYAQKHEPKDHQWKKGSKVFKSEEEAISNL